MKYRVHAVRSGRWWAIEFGEIDDRIHSQSRRLDQVPEMAAEAITMWYGDDDGRQVSPADIEVVPTVGDPISELVSRARHEREHADTAAASAREAVLEAVRAGRDAGLPVRDIGELLGVSHQYAARLARL